MLIMVGGLSGYGGGISGLLNAFNIELVLIDMINEILIDFINKVWFR